MTRASLFIYSTTLYMRGPALWLTTALILPYKADQLAKDIKKAMVANQSIANAS